MAAQSTVFLLSLLILLATACNQSGSGSLNQRSANCDLEKSTCLTANRDLLELKIYNYDPIPLVSPALDVGGACNEGGFPSNKITWSLSGPGVTVASTEGTQGKCIDGRFQLRIALPNTVNYNESYRLTLRLTATDASGNTQANDLLAQKSISATKPAN